MSASSRTSRTRGSASSPRRATTSAADSADVGHHVPAAALARGERQPAAQEVGAAATADVGLGGERPAGAEGLQLALGDQVLDRREADLPGDGRLERLARLGEVGQRGAHVVEAEPGGGVELAALVGVEQDAELVLGLCGDAGGQHVPQPVEHLDLEGLVDDRGHLARPDDAVARARLPDHPDAQAQVGPGLLEDHGRAEEVLVEAALRDDVTGADPVERAPPGGGPVGCVHPERGVATGVLGALGDLVLGVVREDRPVSVTPPGRQAPRARDEQPQVARTDHRHEERRHLVVGRDLVVAAGVESEVRAFDDGVTDEPVRVGGRRGHLLLLE